MELIIAFGILMLIGCIILILGFSITAVFFFIKKEKKLGSVFAVLALIAILGTKTLFFPTNFGADRFKPLMDKRQALVDELEASANQAMGEVTSQGEKRVHMQLIEAKKFIVSIEMKSEGGEGEEKIKRFLWMI